MIPCSHVFDQSTMTALLEHDPLVAQYRAFFALVDWSVVDRWQAQRSACCGSHGHPLTAYLKAFLLRIQQDLSYTTQLRAFLVKHPRLFIELGFQLVRDASQPYGFDVEATLPTRFWLGEKLRLLDRELLTELLASTVRALQAEIPGLGEVVAFDVKHIYAWVKENNQRVYVPDRYDKSCTLAGDPDCKLGVKRSSNQDASLASGQPAPPSTHAHEPSSKANKAHKEYLWGYGSGVAAATDPVYGDVMLAEHTLPFNEADVTYYRPLFQQTVLATNQLPTHITADAAFDDWSV